MSRRALFLVGGALVLGSMLVMLPGRRGPGRSADARADTAIVSRSIAYFESRVAADSINTMAAGHLIDRYILRFQQGAELGDLRRAETLARMVAVESPRGASTPYARLSAVMLMQHEFSGAYAAARQALTEDAKSESAAGVLFDAAMATGRYALADSTLARLRPNTMAWRLRQAHWLTATGQADAAFNTLKRACDQFQDSGARPQVLAWCLTELAVQEHARAGAEPAERLLEKALRVQPGYRAALEKQADLAHARGEWRRAIALYEKAAADAHPDMYLRLAEAHRALGQFDVARTYENRFLRTARAPGSEALYAQPLALFLADQPATRDSALALALRDVARRPAVEGYDVLSWVLYRRGEIEAALAASDSARTFGAPSPTMDFHRSMILAALGRPDEAMRLRSSALRDPTLLAPHARLAVSSVIEQPPRRRGPCPFPKPATCPTP